MKKILSLILALMLLLLCLASCDSSKHEHITGDWKYNEYGHWQPITCSLNTCHIEEAPISDHVDNNTDNICDICGYTQMLSTEQPTDSNTECVHTYGEWRYDETYHWCDWSCSLDLCDIDTTGEHFDEDENGICDKCGYFPPINSDVTGFNLQKIVFDSLESINRTPNNDSDVINGINETIKANSNAYDVIEFCFYYDGNVSEELFENMHHTDIVQANDPTRMIVRVKYNNINIEALKTLSQVSQITSIHISTVSELGVEPEPDVPLDSNNSQSGYLSIGTQSSDVMSSYAISCKIPQEYGTDNTDIPILLSFGLVEGCEADTDSYAEIVLKAENNDGQTVIIKRINISEILKTEYLAESVWDENREWVIGFNYSHTESIVLPISLFSGTSGQIHIGLYECSSTDSETMQLGSGAYIVLYYTRNESSITISAEEVRK